MIVTIKVDLEAPDCVTAEMLRNWVASHMLNIPYSELVDNGVDEDIADEVQVGAVYHDGLG